MPDSTPHSAPLSLFDTKRCSKCGLHLLGSEFHKDARRPDGLFPYCKRCRRKDPLAYDEERTQSAKGLHRCAACRKWLPPEEFYPNTSQARGLHHHCKACACEHSAKWRVRHPEWAKSQDARRYWENRETEAQRHREWSQSSQGKASNARRFNRRKRHEADTPCTLTAEEWSAILEAQNYRCLGCAQDFGPHRPPTRDHILPVRQGGGLTQENVQALCRSCNARKRDRTIDYRPFNPDVSA